MNGCKCVRCTLHQGVTGKLHFTPGTMKNYFDLDCKGALSRYRRSRYEIIDSITFFCLGVKVSLDGLSVCGDEGCSPEIALFIFYHLDTVLLDD